MHDADVCQICGENVGVASQYRAEIERLQRFLQQKSEQISRLQDTVQAFQSRTDESSGHEPCAECQRMREGLQLIATDEHRLMNITARQTAASILAGKPSGVTTTPPPSAGWISVNDRLPKDGDKVIYASMSCHERT